MGQCGVGDREHALSTAGIWESASFRCLYETQLVTPNRGLSHCPALRSLVAHATARQQLGFFSPLAGDSIVDERSPPYPDWRDRPARRLLLHAAYIAVRRIRIGRHYVSDKILYMW